MVDLFELFEVPTQSAQERRSDVGNRSSPTSVWRWRRRRVLIGLTSARRREKYVGTTVGRLLAYVPNTILDLFSTSFPPTLHVARRWNDVGPIPIFSSSTYFRPFAYPHWTSHRQRNDVDPTMSWPTQNPIRPITYPHKTSPRRRSDVGPSSVRSWRCFDRFL